MADEPPPPRTFHGTVGEALAAAEQFYRDGDLARAERLCRQIVRVAPDEAAAWQLGALVALGDGRPQDALDCAQRATAIEPQSAVYHNGLGEAYRALGRLPEANAAYQRSLHLAPEYAQAHCNLGIALREEGRIDEALAAYDRALAIDPHLADAHWNRSLAWLLQGDFERGWSEYEWRWRRTGAKPRGLAQPQWDGSSLAGKTILVYAEQGLGDTLQFIRYARLAKERGGRLIFESPAALCPLLSSVSEIDQLIARGEPLPPFDVQTALLSLPRLFKTTLENVPNEVPYLSANAQLTEHWRARLSQDPGFKIGIVWQGSPRFWRDAQRSIPLSAFAPLARIPGVRLYSLQQGSGTSQLTDAAFEVHQLGEHVDRDSGRFMDTAAIMMSLDLVITSDTAPAHLAGALGVPVWLALSTLPDWRWLVEREDSRWYPTMRLFRQSTPGDWSDVFDRMVVRIEKILRP